jgi:hypothetical protein
MAGDWLKIESATPDKPEVFEIAQQLEMEPEEAFGRLFKVWRWFDQQTENGNADSVTSAYLDRISGVSGFTQAMEKVGWIIKGPREKFGYSLPNFDRHNGQTAKKRGLTAKRVATHKQRSANAEVTPSALPREEKRREEKKERAHRLPADWQPPELLIAWATKERPDLDLTNTVAKFRDFWKAKPGRDGTKLDWNATFRNWVRDEKPGRQSPQKIQVDL